MLCSNQLHQLKSTLSKTNWLALTITLLVSLDYWLALAVGSSISEIHPNNLLLPGKLVAWYLLVCHALIVTEYQSLCCLVAATILPSVLYMMMFFEHILHGHENILMAISTIILAAGSYVYGLYRRMDFALELTVYTCLLLVALLHSPLVDISSYWAPVLENILKMYDMQWLKSSVIYSYTGNLLCLGSLYPMLILWVGITTKLEKEESSNRLEQQWLNYQMSTTAYRLASGLILPLLGIKCISAFTSIKIPLYYLIPHLCLYELATFAAATHGLSLCHYGITILHNEAKSIQNYTKGLIYKAFVGIIFIGFILLRDIFVCIGLLDKLIDTRTRYNMKLSLQH